ncbi:hypothetical protein CT154_05195 [Komagataeibacter xylinus]|uniref:hypothetical protein n=2 Tax=Komagataeibacter rhaeticus TaxID=215221 RepID=UPI0002FB2B07|nr:hypothetical protein [Komagataeibacter rhaeticus]ATU72318.1 hypothetical protein CT154_05195 [Komagataeibacter xylinus]WPP22051.1 hypothetical protein SCD25_00680 [Komagataeibacter rhaeticus]SAY49034.1 hypothetical protein KRIGEM_01992 [Komagataeibacter rhaeticus]
MAMQDGCGLFILPHTKDVYFSSVMARMIVKQVQRAGSILNRAEQAGTVPNGQRPSWFNHGPGFIKSDPRSLGTNF